MMKATSLAPISNSVSKFNVLYSSCRWSGRPLSLSDRPWCFSSLIQKTFRFVLWDDFPICLMRRHDHSAQMQTSYSSIPELFFQVTDARLARMLSKYLCRYDNVSPVEVRKSLFHESERADGVFSGWGRARTLTRDELSIYTLVVCSCCSFRNVSLHLGGGGDEHWLQILWAEKRVQALGS